MFCTNTVENIVQNKRQKQSQRCEEHMDNCYATLHIHIQCMNINTHRYKLNLYLQIIAPFISFLHNALYEYYIGYMKRFQRCMDK